MPNSDHRLQVLLPSKSAVRYTLNSIVLIKNFISLKGKILRFFFKTRCGAVRFAVRDFYRGAVRCGFLKKMFGAVRSAVFLEPARCGF